MASIIGVETLQHTNGTTAATIDSSGRIHTPARPAIAVDGNVASTVTQTANGVITPANLVATANSDMSYSKGGMTYNTTTGEITVPVAGLYLFYGQMYINNTQTGRIALNVNGSGRALGHSDSDGGVSTVHVTALLDLAANDAVTFVSGYATDVYTGSRHTFYHGYLVG